MSQKVLVAGVGMIPFLKPSAAEPYTVMGPKAVRLALEWQHPVYDCLYIALAL